jgi:hypothetical protein
MAISGACSRLPQLLGSLGEIGHVVDAVHDPDWQRQRRGPRWAGERIWRRPGGGGLAPAGEVVPQLAGEHRAPRGASRRRQPGADSGVDRRV